jgi:hypothetical protein
MSLSLTSGRDATCLNMSGQRGIYLVTPLNPTMDLIPSSPLLLCVTAHEPPPPPTQRADDCTYNPSHPPLHIPVATSQHPGMPVRPSPFPSSL